MPDVKPTRTRAQKAQQVHQEATEERVRKANILKASFMTIKDEPAFEHVMYLLQHLADLHMRVAKDGTGYRHTGTKDISGRPEEELVYLSTEKRMSEMDKAAGLEEGLNAIKRQVSDEMLKPITGKNFVEDKV